MLSSPLIICWALYISPIKTLIFALVVFDLACWRHMTTGMCLCYLVRGRQNVTLILKNVVVKTQLINGILDLKWNFSFPLLLYYVSSFTFQNRRRSKVRQKNTKQSVIFYIRKQYNIDIYSFRNFSVVLGSVLLCMPNREKQS